MITPALRVRGGGSLRNRTRLVKEHDRRLESNEFQSVVDKQHHRVRSSLNGVCLFSVLPVQKVMRASLPVDSAHDALDVTLTRASCIPVSRSSRGALVYCEPFGALFPLHPLTAPSTVRNKD
jgi:hypothetical protein